ncbi:MAG: 30S ribosomal protein S2 [Chitinivibrionales bacterium]|nr:30S ribosomal protein S2 [Chitinivibrionales bacterium]
MSSLTLRDLLEAGTHFGHQTKRWNPKMKRYILCPRNGIYIIDLNKTLHQIDVFVNRVEDVIQKGGKILFVGTKKQIKDCVKEEAERCSMPYVTERWLGGMLTNFQTIRQSIRKLEKIETMETDGTIEALPKKEVLALGKQKDKLLNVLSGIRHLRKSPALIFVVDTIKEHIAVAEAQRLRIPVGAIVDTNCNPEIIDYVIPGNDDALKSVQLIVKTVSDAIVSAQGAIREEEMAREENVRETPMTSEEEVESLTPVNDETKDEEELRQSEKKIRKRRVVRRKMTETTEKKE